MVKNFIIKSFNDGYKKLLVVTGKGSRSKSQENPYLSEKFRTSKMGRLNKKLHKGTDKSKTNIEKR